MSGSGGAVETPAAAGLPKEKPNEFVLGFGAVVDAAGSGVPNRLLPLGLATIEEAEGVDEGFSSEDASG